MARVKKTHDIQKFGSEMDYRPNDFAVYVACKGKVFVRWLNTKLKEYDNIVHEAAEKEFRAYPNLKRIVIEVYESDDGKIKLSARTERSVPPKGIIIARCLKFRVSRKKCVIPAKEYVCTRWSFDAYREPNKNIMRQLGFGDIK